MRCCSKHAIVVSIAVRATVCVCVWPVRAVWLKSAESACRHRYVTVIYGSWRVGRDPSDYSLSPTGSIQERLVE